MDVLGRSQIAEYADSCGKLQSIPHHTPEIEQRTRSYKQVFFFSDWIWHLHVSCGSFLLCHELLAVSAQFKPLVLRVIILAGSHLRSYWLNFLRGLPLDLNKPITSIKITGNRKEPHCASRLRLAKHPLLPGDAPFIFPVCFSRWWYSDVCRCLQRLRKAGFPVRCVLVM